MELATTLLAVAATGLFFGAALYITLVEHPARVEAGVDVALRQFPGSYRRAARLQGAAALVGSLAAIVVWIASSALLWLLSAVLLFSVVPFTFLAVFPTNKRLHDPALQPSDPDARKLLARWGRLHLVRTLLSAAAFALQLVALSA